MQNELYADLANKFNVEFEYHWKDKSKIEGVKFNFPDDVWVDIANKEGELLTMCCGNISTIRDEFMDAMREGGCFDIESMRKVVVNMSGHDWEDDHPVQLVANVYDAIKEYVEPGRSIASQDPNDLDDACTRVWFSSVWKFCAKYGSSSMYSDWGKGADGRATHNLALHEIIPTVKVLYEKLHTLKFGPAEGYALVRTANNELYEFNRGLAILPTEEAALNVVNRWIESGSVQKEDIEVRKVRVSFEKGLEFIETITLPWTEPVTVEIDKEQSDDLWSKINALRKENEQTYHNDKVEHILLKALQDIRALKYGEKVEDERKENAWD